MKPLKRIIIERSGDTWIVVRERAENGETMKGAKDLEEAFNYVRCLYDENGEERPLDEERWLAGDI
jgi:hypothetical protein